MQVRAGSVRGLDLHLDRVEANSLKLFGRSASRERVLRAIRHALPTSGNCSIRVTVFTHELRRVFAGEAIEPDLMVSASPSLDADQSPLRVLPLISHPGERADALEGPAGTEAMRRVRRTGRLGRRREAHWVTSAEPPIRNVRSEVIEAEDAADGGEGRALRARARIPRSLSTSPTRSSVRVGSYSWVKAATVTTDAR